MSLLFKNYSPVEVIYLQDLTRPSPSCETQRKLIEISGISGINAQNTHHTLRERKL